MDTTTFSRTAFDGLQKRDGKRKMNENLSAEHLNG